jgi:hypothetical protein
MELGRGLSPTSIQLMIRRISRLHLHRHGSSREERLRVIFRCCSAVASNGATFHGCQEVTVQQHSAARYRLPLSAGSAPCLSMNWHSARGGGSSSPPPLL